MHVQPERPELLPVTDAISNTVTTMGAGIRCARESAPDSTDPFRLADLAEPEGHADHFPEATRRSRDAL
jgi:hypothetical protein